MKSLIVKIKILNFLLIYQMKEKSLYLDVDIEIHSYDIR